MQTPRVAVLVPFLLLSACAFAQTSGNGVSREEAREVPDFSGVAVGHGLRAEVKVGPKSVRISGDENLLALVRTEVVDGTLKVSLERNRRVRTSSGLRVFISSPQVTSVGASGGARVDAEVTATPAFSAGASGGAHLKVRGVDARALEVDASGGSEVTVWGRAETMEADASGGSEIHGRELTLRALEVDASGGSRVEANPSERLEAELSGGSTVSVDSEPAQREVSSSGGSRVVVRQR